MRRHIPIVLLLMFGFAAINLPTVGILATLAYWAWFEHQKRAKKNTSA